VPACAIIKMMGGANKQKWDEAMKLEEMELPVARMDLMIGFLR
jgi:hypothetical protein